MRPTIVTKRRRTRRPNDCPVPCPPAPAGAPFPLPPLFLRPLMPVLKDFTVSDVQTTGLLRRPPLPRAVSGAVCHQQLRRILKTPTSRTPTSPSPPTRPYHQTAGSVFPGNTVPGPPALVDHCDPCEALSPQSGPRMPNLRCVLDPLQFEFESRLPSHLRRGVRALAGRRR